MLLQFYSGNDDKDAPRYVFTSRTADIQDSPVWSHLNFFSCAHNSLVLMGESLQLFLYVETLDLIMNQFAIVYNLSKSSRFVAPGSIIQPLVASLSQVNISCWVTACSTIEVVVNYWMLCAYIFLS